MYIWKTCRKNGLKSVGFDGATTLEITGEENVKTSIERLRGWMG